MLNRIERNHLPIAQPEPRKLAPKAASRPVQTTIAASQPDPVGVALMRSERGDAFTDHYYSAMKAADHVDGRAFLQHYRALKHGARSQGMSAEDFRSFERCLYRRFYRAASRDSMQRLQGGRELKVQAEELAYLARVGGISANQLERDAIAMRRSRCTGEMKAIVARHGGPFSRHLA
ncbi:MAG TPA: hypothetical protein VJR29_11200 [bacterium]|nr:hypothetical protein [bacterium]